jgi:hypothetical protein
MFRTWARSRSDRGENPVEIDPQFQLYRRLSPFEIPPSLSKAFGAKKVLIVTSAQSAPVYAGLVRAWSRDGIETVMDSQQSSPYDIHLRSNLDAGLSSTNRLTFAGRSRRSEHGFLVGGQVAAPVA